MAAPGNLQLCFCTTAQTGGGSASLRLLWWPGDGLTLLTQAALFTTYITFRFVCFFFPRMNLHILRLVFIYKHTVTTVIDSWKKTGVREGGGKGGVSAGSPATETRADYRAITSDGSVKASEDSPPFCRLLLRISSRQETRAVFSLRGLTVFTLPALLLVAPPYPALQSAACSMNAALSVRKPFCAHSSSVYLYELYY